MSNPFFDHPILNSPYEYPSRHWEPDAQGQPTQKNVERRWRTEAEDQMLRRGMPDLMGLETIAAAHYCSRPNRRFCGAMVLGVHVRGCHEGEGLRLIAGRRMSEVAEAGPTSEWKAS